MKEKNIAVYFLLLQGQLVVIELSLNIFSDKKFK